MTNRFPAWPPTRPFPESQQDSTGGNMPDFPGSSGGREQGKFRPSRTPGLTNVAVVNDDGTPMAMTTKEVLNDILVYQRAIVKGLSLITGVDLIEAVQE